MTGTWDELKDRALADPERRARVESLTRELARLRDHLRAVFPEPAAARAWMAAPNPELGGRTPQQCWEAGDPEAIHRALAQAARA